MNKTFKYERLDYLSSISCEIYSPVISPCISREYANGTQGWILNKLRVVETNFFRDLKGRGLIAQNFPNGKIRL